MMIIGLRPAALGPGDAIPADRQSALDQSLGTSTAPSGAAPPGAPPLTAQALRPIANGRDAEPLPDRAPPLDAMALRRPSNGDTPEPDLAVLRPEPAGPLKTFAQIPMQIVQEITRWREEAEQGRAAGIPGRNDPTPMPARPEAIGARMPYDAA